MSVSDIYYNKLFGKIIEEGVQLVAARCACVASNSCTCACSCRKHETSDGIEW